MMKSQNMHRTLWVLGLLLSVLMLPSSLANAQTRQNYLSVGDFEGGVNKTIYVPIYLTNTDSVIAAQFDIELPFAVPTNGTPILTPRANSHSASFSNVSSKTYRVVIMNTMNNALRGNSGLLLRLPMQTEGVSESATEYPIHISRVVLTDRFGNNIATSNTGEGVYQVNRGALPDITVTAITPQPKQCGPGSVFTVSYDVKNIGTGATQAGWTEKIYLESVNGTRTFLGSQAYTNSTLAANGTVRHSFTTTLPAVLHMDGEAYVVVDLIPASGMGELQADQANNSGTSETAISLSKQLYIYHSGNTVYEGSRQGYVTVTLTRSGDWSMSETFTIDCTVSNLLTCNGLTMPCTVTIPALTAGATLRIAAVDDKIVRARETDLLISSTTGYESARLHLLRTDNDKNPLSLALSPSTTLAEGQKLTLTATRGGELTDELTLNVGCSHAARFDKTFTLHFPAGQSLASAEATAINDEAPQLDATVRFTASATDYQNASASTRLTDDDRPKITLSISQPTIMENAETDEEALPVMLTIRRDRGLERNATVWLSCSSSDITFESTRVSIPAGSEDIAVPVMVTDNTRVDGLRNVTITAAYYAPSEQQTAPAGDRAYAQQQLTIIDDETPYLTLSSRVSNVGEGSYVDVTVRRHVPSTSGPLAVTLSCDDNRISFTPQPVTIASGYATATVRVKVARNSVENDDSDITLKATASGVSDGALRLHITDRTLPDAVCTTTGCVGPPYYSGLPATIRATIRNYGTSVLPEGMTIDFYLCSNSRLYYYATKTHFFKATTDEAIAVGGEKTFEFEAQLPQMVGQYWIYARLNADNKIAEFDTGNNLSQKFCPINIEAPFLVEAIAVSPQDVLAGDVVTVQGRMKAVEGSQLNHQTVRVTLNGDGQSSAAETRIDATGNFRVNVRTDRSAHGFMTVKAVALGQTEPAKTATVHVYNMHFTYNSVNWNVDESGVKEGVLTLRNTSAKNITISSFATTKPMPEGAEITFDTSALNGAVVRGGSTVNIPYKVKGLVPSAAWQSFTVIVKSQEGLEARTVVNYFCHATNSYLVFTPSELNTTMLFNANRDNVTVTVTNRGKKATGKIAELITNNWVMSDFGNNRSLAPGESATIRLRFLAQPDMHVGRVYRNLLQLTPETGEAAVLPIKVTTTGNEYSTFELSATDVYSMAENDFSHVANATVTVANARTGATVMTGVTNDEGRWITTQMKEGLYNVTVKATRHVTVTRQLAVGPGQDCVMNMYLPYMAFLADFVVDQDPETNAYTMKQYFNIDYQAPQAIVVASVNDEGFGCGNETVRIILCNEGRRPATNVRLVFPVVGGYTFTQLNPNPTVMMPGDVHVLEVAVEGPNEGRSRVISALKMYYEFEIEGQTLSETDLYQTLVGCVAVSDKPVPPIPPVVKWPPVYPDDGNPDGGDDGSGTPYIPNPYTWPKNPDPENPSPEPGVALPTYKSYMTIDYEGDMDNLHVGDTIRATLRVVNGQEGVLRNMSFLPQILDKEYEDCTSFFTFKTGRTTGFETDGLNYKLAGNAEGTMQLTFIPQDEATSAGPTTYLLYGQVRYADINTGISNAAALPAVEITVHPTGRISLTYLLQRHFLADEDGTEIVEDAQPAMFSLLARNMGKSPVERFKLTSDQPVVVSNATSREVPYTAHYASIDGREGNYSFADFSLDSIGAGATAAARWIYTSEESAHVDSLTSVAEKVVALAGTGNTVASASTHELFHAVASKGTTVAEESDEELTVLDMQIRSLSEADTYLVNDVDDEQNLPDGVINSAGDETPLCIVSQTSFITTGETVGNYTLTVRADSAGWAYGQLHDPTNGLMRLASIIRTSDGQNMSMANFWQTDRTPQTDYSMLQESLLHFADSIKSTEESYELLFVVKPNQPVQLMNVHLYTADDVEVMPGDTTTVPVKKIVTEFTAPLKKFSKGGFTLTAHDKPISLSNAEASGNTNLTRLTLDLSNVEEIPGEHVLNVKGDKQKSATGDKVQGEAEISWVEALEGSSNITINVAPFDECGTTNPTSGDLAWGLQALTATPAEGWQFDSWTDGTTSVLLSTDAHWEFDVWKAQSLTANFSVKKLNVEVVPSSVGGVTTGHPSGVYDYGTVINVVATPAENYQLSYWLVNNERTETDGLQLAITIKDDVRVEAVFIREANLTVDINKGWNWVSSYLNKPLPVSALKESIRRIVSQYDEVINDPVYGFVGTITELDPHTAYKVEATDPVTWSEDGFLYEVEEHPINLMTGWNWISYPYLDRKDIDEVLVNAEEGDYLSGQTGFAEYADGEWEGSLTTFEPGAGYLYKSANDKQLSFDFGLEPEPISQPIYNRVSLHTDASQLVDPHAYPNTMNITARIWRDDREQQGELYTIYALAGDELRGVSQFVGQNHYLTVYGDNPVTISFIVEDNGTGETYMATESLTFNSDVVGSRKAPYALTIGSPTDIGQLPTFSHMTIHTIKGILVSRKATPATLQRLPAGVYIVNGQKIAIK